jgi:hypothetical protein
MNKPDKFEEDLLRQYIDRDRIEKAPEGFTQKVMTSIRSEAEQVKMSEKIWSKSIIPVISAVITLILIIVVIYLPESSYVTHQGLKFLQDLELPSINISFDSVKNLNLPIWINYIFVGIFLLAIFDKLLSGLFHREKK